MIKFVFLHEIQTRMENSFDTRLSFHEPQLELNLLKCFPKFYIFNDGLLFEGYKIGWVLTLPKFRLKLPSGEGYARRI